MTENEAIRDLQYLIGEYSAYPPETGVNATVGSLQYCITALKEIQQYREIGTVEECREAMEKSKSLDAYVKQVLWERDIAIQQLEEIGVSLGEKMDAVKEAVEKQKPKKPHRNYKKFSGLWCKCGWYLGQKQCLDIKYCPNCGQAIDENLEGME